jgi:hypothetical protein
LYFVPYRDKKVVGDIAFSCATSSIWINTADLLRRILSILEWLPNFEDVVEIYLEKI